MRETDIVGYKMFLLNPVHIFEKDNIKQIIPTDMEYIGTISHIQRADKDLDKLDSLWENYIHFDTIDKMRYYFFIETWWTRFVDNIILQLFAGTLLFFICLLFTFLYSKWYLLLFFIICVGFLLGKTMGWLYDPFQVRMCYFKSTATNYIVRDDKLGVLVLKDIEDIELSPQPVLDDMAGEIFIAKPVLHEGTSSDIFHEDERNKNEIQQLRKQIQDLELLNNILKKQLKEMEKPVIFSEGESQ